VKQFLFLAFPATVEKPATVTVLVDSAQFSEYCGVINFAEGERAWLTMIAV
jgi:hypothetical protein